MKILNSLGVIILLITGLVLIGHVSANAEVTVYDSEGQYLGVLLGKSAANTLDVYEPSVNKIFTIIIDRNSGKAVIVGRSLYFKSTNCTGIAYVQPLMSNEIIENNGIYYTGDEVEPVSIIYKSALQPGNASCYLFSSDLSIFAVPALEIVPPVELPITLPLSFNLEPTHPGKWK